MKKKTKIIVTLMLAFVLVSALMSASAYADFAGQCKVGDTISNTTVFTTTSKILSFAPASGSLPSGIIIDNNETTLFISGSPQSSGTFESGYWVTTEAGTESFKLTIAVTAVAAATAAPTATAKPTAAPTATALPKITKHPTGETVEVGGSAMFVARADNASEIVWRIVSADTTNTIPAADAASYFSGVSATGLGTETLTLTNIPKSMNGWSVECKFVNSSGASFTNGAIIKVVDKTTGTTTNNNNTTQPTPGNGGATTGTTAAITTQPRGVETEVGKNYTLSVAATSPNSGKLTYQWYSSTTNSRANIISIKDATASTYTPPQTEGTVYYCVAVINTKDNKQSTPVYSDLVAVRYNAAAASPTPSATPAPASDTPSPTATPQPDNSSNNRYTLTSSLIFFAVMGVLAVAAMVVIIIYIKRSGKDEDDD